MTERNVLFLIMVPIGTNRKALAFLPLYKRSLGDIPSRWEVKGVSKGDRNRTKRFLFPLGRIESEIIIEIKK